MLELIDGRDQATPVRIARPAPIGRPSDPAVEAKGIVDDVRLRGDLGLLQHIERQTGARLVAGQLRVDPDEITRAMRLVRPELVDALEVMREQLRATSERQLPQTWIEQRGDQMVGELVRPLRRVGVLVSAPGARSTAQHASTVLMAAVPAAVAGVPAVAVCAPPTGAGDVGTSVLAACAVAGVTEVYRMAGPQAVAALAYGTETVRPTEAVVGPGDAQVTAAKRMVRGWVSTDESSWPTELAIVADDASDPAVLAADLVAQAERGSLGAHLLITWMPELLDEVITALDLVVAGHPDAEQIENRLIEGGRAVLVRDLGHALDTANAFAPQHLQLVFAGALDALDRVGTAGAVSVGRCSSAPVAGYVAGATHLIPSAGASRWASALGARHFVKTIPVSGLEPSALDRLAPHALAIAEADGRPGAARSIAARLEGNQGGRS